MARAITDQPIAQRTFAGLDDLIDKLQGVRASVLQAGAASGDVNFRGQIILTAGESPNSFNLTILKRN